MSVTALVDQDPWPAITRSVSAAKTRVVAAIGYVGAQAFGLLPLKSGDVLVCDASDRAVMGGATNPEGLRVFLDHDVEVWSEEGLHAKVVVLARRAFVGSMNASQHSATRLIEACIETTDPSVVSDLRTFVLSAGQLEIDYSDIDRLVKLVPDRTSKPPVRRRPTAVPKDLDRVVVVGIEYTEWSETEDEVHVESRTDARKHAREVGSFARTEPLPVGRSVFDAVEEGDWVVQVSDRSVFSPGLVVARLERDDAHLLWLARPDSISIPRSSSTAKVVPNVDDVKTVLGPQAGRIVAAFDQTQP